MGKTACYIDGFNLYHSVEALHLPRLKWLNLQALAKTFLRPGETLERVVYFSALMVWDKEKLRRHKEYIAALEASGVEVVLSKFQKSNKHCKTFDRYCGFHEEKQTDVAFAARVLHDAISGAVNRVILLTADSDQVPTVATIRGLTVQTEVFIACPPGRKSIARELTYIAHDSREISSGRLDQCLFPRNVRNSKGTVVAKRPATYA